MSLNNVICKHCEEGDLHWEEIADGIWRLYDEEDEIHVCGITARVKPQDEFDQPEPTEEEWSEGEQT